MAIIGGMGATVENESPNAIAITGGNEPRRRDFNAGEAGLSLRMFAPILALFDREVALTGKGSLLARPIGMIEGPLRALGARVRTENGFPPVTLQGPLRGGRAEVDGSVSSQFLSGLLLATPLCENDTTLIVNGLKSAPYVRMTLEILRNFALGLDCDNELTRFDIPGRQSYRPLRYRVEGDWSGAAFLLVAGAVAGRAAVRDLNPSSLQADRRILE
ncbi:MAG: 3-phosphoshikimate 1-carboxyvinyltransferase, partial [Myxococcales bacterium]